MRHNEPVAASWRRRVRQLHRVTVNDGNRSGSTWNEPVGAEYATPRWREDGRRQTSPVVMDRACRSRLFTTEPQRATTSRLQPCAPGNGPPITKNDGPGTAPPPGDGSHHPAILPVPRKQICERFRRGCRSRACSAGFPSHPGCQTEGQSNPYTHHRCDCWCDRGSRR